MVKNFISKRDKKNVTVDEYWVQKESKKINKKIEITGVLQEDKVDNRNRYKRKK